MLLSKVSRSIWSEHTGGFILLRLTYFDTTVATDLCRIRSPGDTIASCVDFIEKSVIACGVQFWLVANGPLFRPLLIVFLTRWSMLLIRFWPFVRPQLCFLWSSQVLKGGSSYIWYSRMHLKSILGKSIPSLLMARVAICGLQKFGSCSYCEPKLWWERSYKIDNRTSEGFNPRSFALSTTVQNAIDRKKNAGAKFIDITGSKWVFNVVEDVFDIWV